MRTALSGVLLLGACTPTLKGNGVPATEIRMLAPFEAVAAATFTDVAVQTGTSHQAIVFCDTNLLRKIRTDVLGDAMVNTMFRDIPVRTGLDCNVEVTAERIFRLEATAMGDLEVDERLPDLALLRSTGSGDVHLGGATPPGSFIVLSTGSGDVAVDTVIASEVVADKAGSGDLFLAGETEAVDFDNAGSGTLDARDLLAAEARVSNIGSGDVHVFASQRIVVSLNGAGDVHIWGDPDEVELWVNGPGRVFFRY